MRTLASSPPTLDRPRFPAMQHVDWYLNLPMGQRMVAGSPDSIADQIKTKVIDAESTA